MENVNKPSTSIKNWAIDDRPREKLLVNGAASLSNSELIAILINNGSKNKSAVELAREILKLGNDNLNELGKLSLNDFKQVKGIGEAKSIIIAAALELGRERRPAHQGLVLQQLRRGRALSQWQVPGPAEGGPRGPP